MWLGAYGRATHDPWRQTPSSWWSSEAPPLVATRAPLRGDFGFARARRRSWPLEQPGMRSLTPANGRWSGAPGRRPSERQGRRERLRCRANRRRSPCQRAEVCNVDSPYLAKPLDPPTSGAGLRGTRGDEERALGRGELQRADRRKECTHDRTRSFFAQERRTREI
jgi:hypothetical protein